MKHDIDWSKSHNGVMLCTLAETKVLMPEVLPILQDLFPEDSWDNYYIDVKVHMLMPQQFPCIPNWHFDFLPRDAKGDRIQGIKSDKKMYMWISSAPLTLYKDAKDIEYEKPAQAWHPFTQHDLHRGQVSQDHVWRCFIRVIPKEFVHDTTINMGQQRRHIQVYADSRKFKW